MLRITEDLGRRFKHERDRTSQKYERDERDSTSDKHEIGRTSEHYEGDEASDWETLTLCGNDVREKEDEKPRDRKLP